ncbi:hypothetical protein GM921_00800 [Pedobacter sp. LMG 31464]|uniref:Prepilin-type N-terminal cleavage/methylation domain-containing protein n=1 Tax=Pedobacter planticolens TaxID=2679964 RepID=A0A923DXW0_9SPHI|nr:prepilin-type N-terminal cleavage/methylation domain-containing protein [Pedobacter planticolens]MBB2144009.1 hypothetical protein [Pedobacter planticolens]
MAQLNKKLSASTLVEVLVAMLIIMIVFAIASKIYLNSFMQIPSYTKLMVNQQLEHQLQQIQAGEIAIIDEVTIDEIVYHYEISESQIDGLKLIEITATQEQQIISKIKGLIAIPHIDEQN